MKFFRSKTLAILIFTAFLSVSTIPYAFSEAKECGCSASNGGMVSVTYSYLSDDDGNCCTAQSGAALVETNYSFFWTVTLSLAYASVGDAQKVCCN
jgi:hypothetical protein